jgi:methionine sulfoxide reductase heme-binding subunit
MNLGTSPGMTSALWDLGRGTGVVALVMFTLSLVLGIVARSGREVPWLGRFGISDLHRTAALTGTGLVVVHVGSLLVDPYAQLKLADLLFPFLATYRPLWVGLGTLAVDVLFVVTGASLLRQRVGPKVFRTVHWATYVLWPMVLLHALGSGTNATASWFRGLAAVCVTVVVAAVGWRLAPSFAERGWNRRTRRTV